ncbi:metallophosphoesterase [Lichenibacterium ramalinae]|uniref:Serine/threonine protein phosphatase n=1 Tax=Lichenibacterium ramalinae TaxID=2316527 RepID=A0A4Q2RD44_9HYPH|nr:metallophosphoesterase [Lichenibacterium ramalinae]RYB03888.1 serine/threonine protein phosphatase [Lichenibacterium ramalinae]
MRTVTYAIGDIHGRLDLLDDLLDLVEADAAERRAAAKVVFTGDYMDRGPASRGVVARVMAGPRRPGDSFVPLQGNHDDLFATAVARGPVIPDWAWTLFTHTVLSYGVTVETMAGRDGELRRHAAYLAALPLTHDDGTHLFVHAGIRPGVPLDRQDPEDLIWIREPFLTFTGRLPRRVVHGHTIMGDRPVVTPNRISIDTGAFRSGRLTAAVLDPEAGSEPSFLQAVGEPDRAALVREALLVESIAGRPVSPELQAVFDDFAEGRIDLDTMERRSTRLGAGR